MIDVNALKKLLKKRRFGENIIISKRIMKTVPKECEETILGDLMVLTSNIDVIQISIF